MNNEETAATSASDPSESTPATGGDAAASPTATATAPAPKPKPTPSGPPPDGHWWWGTGRRKAAVARVRIKPGKGDVMVNKRPLTEYFNEERDHNDICNVLDKTGTRTTVDVHVNVHGGGFSGQAGAIVLGIGRALLKFDQSLEPILRDNDFLTRDPRRVERKKYGQPGARKRFQFSKR